MIFRCRYFTVCKLNCKCTKHAKWTKNFNSMKWQSTSKWDPNRYNSQSTLLNLLNIMLERKSASHQFIQARDTWAKLIYLNETISNWIMRSKWEAQISHLILKVLRWKSIAVKLYFGLKWMTLFNKHNEKPRKTAKTFRSSNNCTCANSLVQLRWSVYNLFHQK